MAAPGSIGPVPIPLRPAFPLATERLLLRPFADADLDALWAIQRRQDVTRFLYWGPRSREQCATMIAHRKQLLAIEQEGDGFALAVTIAATGALIGDVDLQWRSAEHRQGEVG